MIALPATRSTLLSHPNARVLLLGAVLFPAIYYPLQMLVALSLIALAFPSQAQQLLGQGSLVLRAAHPRLHLVPYGIAVLLAAVYGFQSGLPTSDGLRHIVAYQVGYDWTSHYGNQQYFTPWSWWIGFEVVAGAIHRLTGQDLPLTGNILQTLTSCIVLLGLARAFAVLLPGSVAMQCLLLCIAIPLLQPRLVGARPEVLMLFVIPAVLWMPRRIWLPVALLLSPAYWFSPVYGIASLLFPARTWRDLASNLAVGALYSVGAVAFWLWYSDGDFFQIRTLLSSAIAEQDFKVDELQPIAHTLINAQVLPALAGFVMALYLGLRQSCLTQSQASAVRLRAIGMLAVALFFCAPDYARYYAIATLMVLLASASLFSLTNRPPVALMLVGVALNALFFTLFRIHPTPPPRLLDDAVYSVPDGARVLAPFSVDAYLATATNPAAKVTPTFDPGMVLPDARALVNALNKGTFPACDELVGRFDYVAESRVAGRVPACLELVHFHDRYRLWRVVTP